MLSDTILHQLIVDPLLPLPEQLSKRDLKQVRDLRAAYAAVFRRQAHGQEVRTPEQAAQILAPLLAGTQCEHLMALALNTRSCVIHEPIIVSKGDIDGTDAGPRMVFRTALQAGAASVLVAHNHPTGNPQPSANDLQVTKRLVEAGRILDLGVADHLIIGTPQSWVSLRRDQPQLWQGVS